MAKRSTSSELKKPVCPLGNWCWIRHTQKVASITPTNAPTAFSHFHSRGIIKSMSRMPSAKMVSSTIGSISRYSIGR